MATSSLQNVVHAKVLNVVQKQRVFKISQFPKWFLKNTEFYGAASRFGNRAWFNFLHCSHCSSGSNSALSHVGYTLLLGPQAVDLNSQTVSTANMRINPLAAKPSMSLCPQQQLNCLNAISCLKHHLSLPKTTLHGCIGQWLLGGKAKVIPAVLQSPKWKGNLCLQAEQLWLIKYSMQKPLLFILKV